MRGRITGQQRGDLVSQVRLPELAQQAGDAVRVAEGGARSATAVTWSCAPATRSLPSRMVTAYGSSPWGTCAAGSRASSARTWCPTSACQNLPSRKVSADGSPTNGRAVGHRGDLVLRARHPQTAQQEGDAARAVEGDVRGRITGQQRGDLVLRARLPQDVQQAGDAVRLAEGDVRGGALGQRGDLVLRARLPQAVQQAGDAARVAEGGVRGRITG